MPHDDALTHRLRELTGDEPDVTERRMFGGVAFLAGGHLAVGASGQGGLMVRVDPAQTDALRGEPGTAPMVMRGRELDGWVRVDAATAGEPGVLETWVARGLAFARSLPPKD